MIVLPTPIPATADEIVSVLQMLGYVFGEVEPYGGSIDRIKGELDNVTVYISSHGGRVVDVGVFFPSQSRAPKIELDIISRFWDGYLDTDWIDKVFPPEWDEDYNRIINWGVYPAEFVLIIVNAFIEEDGRELVSVSFSHP